VHAGLRSPGSCPRLLASSLSSSPAVCLSPLGSCRSCLRPAVSPAFLARAPPFFSLWLSPAGLLRLAGCGPSGGLPLSHAPLVPRGLTPSLVRSWFEPPGPGPCFMTCGFPFARLRFSSLFYLRFSVFAVWLFFFHRLAVSLARFAFLPVPSLFPYPSRAVASSALSPAFFPPGSYLPPPPAFPVGFAPSVSALPFLRVPPALDHLPLPGPRGQRPRFLLAAPAPRFALLPA